MVRRRGSALLLCCSLSLFSLCDAQCYSWMSLGMPSVNSRMSLGKPPISPWEGEHPPTTTRTAVVVNGSTWLIGRHARREALPLVSHVPVSCVIFLCGSSSFFCWSVDECFFFLVVCRFFVFVVVVVRCSQRTRRERRPGRRGGCTILFLPYYCRRSVRIVVKNASLNKLVGPTLPLIILLLCYD